VLLRLALVTGPLAALAGSAWGQAAEQNPDAPAAAPGWRAASGLRAEQWIAPRGGGMGLDVRLTLPEMERGRFGVETFSWERLDVMEEELDPDEGTVYQVLGVRRWFGGERAGVFAGAHVMSFAGGDARGFTPWFGFRIGAATGGPSLAADVRLLGLGVVGWRGGGVDSGEVALRVTGPRVGRFRLGGRGRLRSVVDVQREATMSAGIETPWRGRPLFLGLGFVTLERAAASAPADPEPMATSMMAITGTSDSAAPRPTSAILLQLEVDMDLPRSLAE
jgi:hypothetical protein